MLRLRLPPHRTPPEVAATVSGSGPIPPCEPRRTYRLALAEVHPLIRVAHRCAGTGVHRRRIVFDHELILILAGAGEFWTGEVRRVFRPGSLLLIPPWTPHHQVLLSDGAGEHLAVHFDWRSGVPPGDDPSRRRPNRVIIDDGPPSPAVWHGVGETLAGQIARIITLHHRRRPDADLLASATLQHVIAGLSCLPPDDGLPDALAERIAPALAGIHADHAAPWSVEALASACDMSRSRFAAAFRRVTGVSVMEYLRRFRVDRARDLLAGGDDDLATVARACGFADAFHLSKVFRRIDGLPPSAFRAEARAGRRHAGV